MSWAAGPAVEVQGQVYPGIQVPRYPRIRRQMQAQSATATSNASAGAPAGRRGQARSTQAQDQGSASDRDATAASIFFFRFSTSLRPSPRSSRYHLASKNPPDSALLLFPSSALVPLSCLPPLCGLALPCTILRGYPPSRSGQLRYPTPKSQVTHAVTHSSLPPVILPNKPQPACNAMPAMHSSPSSLPFPSKFLNHVPCSPAHAAHLPPSPRLRHLG